MSYHSLTMTCKLLLKHVNPIFFIILVKLSIGDKRNQYRVYYGKRTGNLHGTVLWGEL